MHFPILILDLAAHLQPPWMAGIPCRAAEHQVGQGSEFSWEWRKRSGGYGMDCPEDRRLVVSQLALRAAQKDS